jgi:hypothetical protein
MLEKLNTMVVARGVRPITEDGSVVVDGPRPDDDWRSGLDVLDVLDELYQEIPDEIKKSHNLLPFLADYIAKESAEQDNRRQR